MAYFIATTEKISVKKLARLFRENISKETCQVIQRSYLEIAWTFRKYYIGQRSIVCSRNDKEVEQATRDLDKAVNSLLSPNRWANREDQSEAGTIPKGLY